MQLYYWKSAQGNVGDDLNPWLWSRVFGDAFFDGDPRERLVAVLEHIEPARLGGVTGSME